ncbi:ABC-type sugar transport system, substrate-binding protein, contains N-terminal xre family HTH domain [Thermoactinomyces sp. DSM 45891]|uniref:substrate-binding domain-containing protein n=1 Tax=Thermoactinomyces sp. DSM 45891 TaxID=1761907 RepID=UPI000921B7C6|nr:substrate-binding domain-containing protein [Thermoactinomyces sp. DSM 45891]SFX65452.1 ABC-type sugar transport system, substrate-binding protein, contains N-terminal xre family HTH domain [Thermoactinomyces sp. DSM 45891]
MRKRNVLIGAISLACLLLIYLPIYQLTHTYQTLQQIHKPASSVKETFRIALISPAIRDLYFKEVESGVQEVAKKQGIMVEVHGGYKGNALEMARDIQKVTSAKVDGIITVGMDDPTFIQAVNQATEGGIPVILIGTDVPSSLRKMYVGSDHVAAGRILGEKVRVDLEKKSSPTVGIIGQSTDQMVAMLRIRGVEQSLASQKSMQVVKQIYDSSEKNGTMQTMSQIHELLNRTSNLDAIVVSKGEELEAVIRVIKQRVGLGKIQIYTFQDVAQLTDVFAQGQVQAVVVDNPRKMGEESIMHLLSWIRGEQLPLPSHIYTDSTLETSTGSRFRNEEH